MKSFRVGLSADLRNPDGSPTMPEFDLSPLADDPRIECVTLPAKPTLAKHDLAGFDAVILSLERVGAESFPDHDRLALIARFGVGYDAIDVNACTAHAVALAIAPEGMRRPVAVSVITLMLALTTKLMAKDRISRAGPEAWIRSNAPTGVGLVGRALGSLGLGNIGAEVFRLARPFEMRFLAHDAGADPAWADSLGVRLVGLDDLFREADVLSINCPLTPRTRGLVDERRLSLMKPSAFLINTARGPIVDQAALTQALARGRIAGAGLDVLEKEPPDPGDPILQLDNVIVTPHALCWTDQCLSGSGAADIRAVQAVMGGRAPDTVVNREVLEDSRFRAKLATYVDAWGR